MPRNFIAETNPEFIPGVSSLGSSESWPRASKFPADRAKPTDKIQCLSMAKFDGVPGCNSTESEKDSRRSTLIRDVGHCYGRPARIARKQPTKTGNHGTHRTHGSQKTGRRATTEHSEHTEVRKPEEEQPRNTQNTRKSENRKRSNHGTPRTHGRQKTGRRATTEHTEHTEVRKPEEEQPRNTQNTRKTENRKRNNHGTHRTRGSQEITEEQRTGEREVWIGGRRCSVDELQRQRPGGMARGQFVWDEKQKTPARKS